MRSRSARGFGAYCAIVAMLFGQFALAAYACAAPRPVMPDILAHAMMNTEAGQFPCAEMLTPGETPQANACEVHCTDGLTSAGQPDCPPVSLALLPAPTLALASLPTFSGVARLAPVPLSGAPPPTVRFCRLLI
jgi:hypothetical protein